jgi:hypothetical protein
MSIPWTDIGTVSTAGLSAIATWGAWRAAARSAKTANTVARIERQRWHADLTPQFDIRIESSEGGRTTLSVRLVGPVPLERLDEIVIRIVSSDDMDRTVRLPGGPTQADVDAQVWGPCRFSQGADGADENGQTVNPFSLRVGTGRPFSIERTRHPRWQVGADAERRWRGEWMNKPMRMVITCRREEFEPWVVPYEVEIPQATRTRWLS